MPNRGLVFCGWCGIAAILLMVIGLGPMAHMTPPLSPTIGAADIATHFRRNASGILIGAFLVNIAVALSIALVAGISAQIRRMAFRSAQVLSYLQLASGTAASIFLMLPALILSTAAFRADRPAELVLMLHDLATFATFLPFSVATMEALVIAAAIFCDRSAKQAFPRWLAYFNIVAGLSYVPMGLVAMSKASVFASNGLLGWWVPTIIVGPWYVLMGIFLISAGRVRPDLGAE
jgi:hypothetical protein